MASVAPAPCPQLLSDASARPLYTCSHRLWHLPLPPPTPSYYLLHLPFLSTLAVTGCGICRSRPLPPVTIWFICPSSTRLQPQDVASIAPAPCPQLLTDASAHPLYACSHRLWHMSLPPLACGYYLIHQPVLYTLALTGCGNYRSHPLPPVTI